MSDTHGYISEDSEEDTFDGLLELLESPVERLLREVRTARAATSRAYNSVERLSKELQLANTEFQKQQQQLNIKREELVLAQKREELVLAQEASDHGPDKPVEQYFAELKRSRQGKSYIQWMRDASLNYTRQRLYEMYKKLVVQSTMPAFGKYLSE